MRLRLLSVLGLGLSFALGCSSGGDAPSEDDDVDEGAYTSASGTLQNVEFDGQLLTSGGFDPKKEIESQMYFTIGQFNGESGVARLDKMTITNLKSVREGDLTKITYHMKLPLSIRQTSKLPSTYKVNLPMRVDYEGQSAFFDKYKDSCVDPNAHDNEVGIFWYYYRPKALGCTLDPKDMLSVDAKVRKSPENTIGKYPQYDKIWEDNQLRIVAIYGKVEDGAKTESDRGIWSYDYFIAEMKKMLPGNKTTPAVVPERPGIAVPQVTIDGTLPGGKKVSVTAFLVDNVREGGPEFEAKYNALSTNADVIVYNGHAGLGQNVRKLATMGTFKKGQYQLFYMNGCDTFAYVDGTMAQTRAKLNADDPTGTKYMEILTNSMPPNWDSLPINTVALTKGLLKYDAPMNYLSILKTFDQSGIVTVTGEEDNTFKP
ncbi:MAG: Alkaline serine protease [Myxococcaceae bacterium]|jgi:hypothetical protein|nr:Alkaline serine protease [Myxococcaceae bacterium]